MQKNSKIIVKKHLLNKKINERFSKNPQLKSLIVKADPGGSIKTYWKIVKEGTKFHIVEVNTNKETFIFEAEKIPAFQKYQPKDQMIALKKLATLLQGNQKAEMPLVKALGLNPDQQKTLHDLIISQQPQHQAPNAPNPKMESALQEASAQFTNLSRTFMNAMQNLSDHVKLSQALNTLNKALPSLTDANERVQAGSMIGALTGAVDSSTKGSTRMSATPNPVPSPTPGAMKTMQTSSKKVNGNVIKEDEDKKKDQNQEQDQQPPEEIKKDKTEEETSLADSLKSQTIKEADIELSPNGGSLTLQLVSALTPFVLAWNDSGKVSFVHKGRPYILRKSNVTDKDKGGKE